MGTGSGSLQTVRLTTPVKTEDLKGLEIGTVVYLTGRVYTGREGVYTKVVDEGEDLPVDLSEIGNVNFHCSPAAVRHPDGSFEIGAVTATASFRFAKWLPEWMAKTGAKLIIGKGGMSSKDYKSYFVPNGAIYLSTVGYGTGALLGRGIEKVEAVHWQEELGLAQAMWVIRCNKMGPFIVASDLEGNCLFERENAKIAENLARVYEGTRPATLKRYGETDDRSDEVIG